LQKACPFYSPDDELCCLADTISITAANFNSLEAVFNADSSVCSVNLMTMWCHYACDPYDAYFKTFIGIEPKTGYAQANFNINSDYACELF